MEKVKPLVFKTAGAAVKMPFVGVVQTEENGYYSISVGDDIKGLKPGSLLALRLPNGVQNYVFIARVEKFVDRPAGIRRAVLTLLRGVWFQKFSSPKHGAKPLENVYVRDTVYMTTVMNAAQFKHPVREYIEGVLKSNNHPSFMPIKAYAYWVTGDARKLLDKRIDFDSAYVTDMKINREKRV